MNKNETAWRQRQRRDAENLNGAKSLHEDLGLGFLALCAMPVIIAFAIVFWKFANL